MPTINKSYDVAQRLPVEKIRKTLGIKPPVILQEIGTAPRLKNTGIEWYEDEVIGLYATGTGSGTSGEITATDTTINVSTAEVFRAGDIVEVENERMKVTAVDYTANTITVERGFQGTTATTHPANSKVEVVSSVAPEGELIASSRVSRPIKHTNVTQVFQDRLFLTATLEAIEPEWARDEKARQIQQKIYRLDSLKAKSIWYGIRYDSASSAERTMGGVDFFVANKVDAGGATLTPDMIIDQLIEMDNDGVFDMGLSPEIWLNPVYAKVVNDWMANQVMVERTDERVGRVVKYLVTNVGEIPIKYDRHIKPGEVFLIDPKAIKKAVLRPEQTEKLGKTKDGTEYLIVEEFTIKIEYPSAWRKLFNVAVP